MTLIVLFTFTLVGLIVGIFIGYCLYDVINPLDKARYYLQGVLETSVGSPQVRDFVNIEGKRCIDVSLDVVKHLIK